MFKKIIALILSAAFIILAAACMENNSGRETKGTAEAPSTGDARLYPDLPEVNYGGYDFIFYSWDIEGWRVYEDIWVEDSGTNAISKSVFNRNSRIEEKYGIVISYKADYYEDYAKKILANMQVGDHIGDVLLSMGLSAGLLMRQGVYYNLYDVPYIDFTKPWWDQDCTASLSVGNYMPFGSSAITLIEKAGAYCMFYNLGLADDLNIDENLYKTVTDGDWTLDKMKTLGRIAVKDLNGDSEMKFEDDRFGIAGNDSAVTAFFSGSGMRIVSKEKDGTLYDSFMEGNNVEKIKNYLENILFDKELFLNCSYRYEGDKGINYNYAPDIFMENRALFLQTALSKGESLRGMENAYAILPVPKYDAAQEKYGCAPNTFDNFLTSVPIWASEEDVDRTGVILEALAAESYYTVIPAFYEQVLDEKIARDDESKQMIDIITNSHVWDAGEFYGLGAFGDHFRGCTGRSEKISGRRESSDIASFYAAYGGGLTADLASLIEVAEKYADR